MGAFVLLNVHGADLVLLEGDGLFLERQKHIGLVLKPVPRHVHQLLHCLPGQRPQAGLGVGNGHAHEGLEHQRRGVVAEPAAIRHVVQRKVPAAQNAVSGLQHFLAARPGILGVVLVVAVHRHDAGAFGTVVQKPPESGLQSRALPPVYLMMEQMNFGMSRGGVREIM